MEKSKCYLQSVHKKTAAVMDRGALRAMVRELQEAKTAEHTHTQYLSAPGQINCFKSSDQVVNNHSLKNREYRTSFSSNQYKICGRGYLCALS